MPVRTSPSAVQGILLMDYDTINNPSLTPFIETASVIADEVADYASENSIAITSEKLELIERWLAAHCYCLSDQPYTFKQTKAVSANFQGKTAMYFEATKYGQMAVTLDSTGYLSTISEGNVGVTVSGIWLGKPPSQQIPYVDRD